MIAVTKRRGLNSLRAADEPDSWNNGRVNAVSCGNAAKHEALLVLNRAYDVEVRPFERSRMEEKQAREEFDTGLAKIRSEIKSLLVPHGFFGNITHVDIDLVDEVATGARIEIDVKGRRVARSFSRPDIERCYLRVGGPVLVGITSMVEELAAHPAHTESALD
jgi:hypothetical protein